MMQMHYFHETCALAHREGGVPLFTEPPSTQVFSLLGNAEM